ncbi:hypothetical protein HD554DRAFT_2036420 [Boletus coccyginus]|nr:hypothetical protein HD554DRAFT_2036420 [Boletus coccyginus]
MFYYPICNAKYWYIQPSCLKAGIPYSFLGSRGRKQLKLTWPLIPPPAATAPKRDPARVMMKAAEVSSEFKDLRGFVDRNEFNLVLVFGCCSMISHYVKHNQPKPLIAGQKGAKAAPDEHHGTHLPEVE